MSDLYKQFENFPKDWQEAARNFGLKKVSNKYVHAFLNNRVPKKDFGEEFKKKSFDLESYKTKKKKVVKKKQALTAAKKRELKILQLEKNLDFQSVLPLNELWIQYMDNILPKKIFSPGSDLTEAYQILLKADYHGCFVVVSATVNPSYVGVKGIIAMETKNTFKIVTPENIVKTIPKNNSIFVFALNEHVFKIVGSNFCYHSSGRCKVKFRTKYMTAISL